MMPHAKPVLRFIKKPDGTHDVAILVSNVKTRRNPDGASWTIIDHSESLDQTIVCDGDAYRPKFILKLYCKAPGNSARKIRRRLLIARFRRGERSIQNALPL